MTEPTPAPPPAGTSEEQVLFEGYPATIRSIGELCLVIITVGIAFLVLMIKRRNVSYRVTTQRIVIEQGILNKRLDQVDLYRITDYVVDLPLGQRMMGTGNLILKAMDNVNPEVRLDGLKTDVRQLYENIRKATETEKQRRGVRVIDAESHIAP